MRKEVTINGETREVEFMVHGNFAESIDMDAHYSKHGGKVWTQGITLKNLNDEWVLDTNRCILNRNGYRLRGWANEINEAHKSRHNSA